MPIFLSYLKPPKKVECSLIRETFLKNLKNKFAKITFLKVYIYINLFIYFNMLYYVDFSLYLFVPFNCCYFLLYWL